VSPASPASAIPAARRSCRRTIPVLLSALLTLGLLVPMQLVGAGSAAAAVVAPGASPAHPYSQPVWWPFHDTAHSAFDVRMDCAAHTPGCLSSHQHGDQAVTLQTVKHGEDGGPGNYVHAAVYAAGAGIVHIGSYNPTRNKCGSNAPAMGNYLTVDHGGGVTTRYGHLASIRVHEGEYVSPSTVLGTTGSSGAHNDCYVDYLNFRIARDNTGVLLGTFQGCSTDRVPLRYDTLNDVPHRTLLNRAGTACPTSPPRTFSQPRIGHLGRIGYTGVTAHWAAPSTKPRRVQVLLELYHTVMKKWLPENRLTLTVGSRTPTSHSFRGLRKGASYRVQVSFGNGYGWSRGSAWVYRRK
jgi:Peptidase family M23